MKELVSKCAKRLVDSIPFILQEDIEMDLEKCILGGCKLDLEALYQANDEDFFYNMNGIVGQVSPSGRIVTGFVPTMLTE